MPINVNIEAKEIAKCVTDLFSPLTEIAGAIGDHIRIYREISVLKTLQRVKNIVDDKEITLKTPPLKFLVPFLESSSLEDDNKDTLIRLWTNLLISASTDYKSEHNLFIRILNELSPQEARKFQYVAKSNVHASYTGYEHLEDVEAFWVDSYVYIALKKILEEIRDKDLHNIDFYIFEKRLKERIQAPGSLIYYFWVATGEKDKFPYTELYTPERTEFDDKYYDKVTFSILKNLGLVGEFRSPGYWFDDIMFEMDAYYLTPLGASFYSACVEDHC